MDYYNVDTILADEEKLNVKFDHTIKNFGFYISPSTLDIKKGFKVDLPCFLIKFLLKNDHCSVESCLYFDLENDFAAAASIVNLRDTHFFLVESQFIDTEIILNIFFERLGDFLKYIIKEDFSENDMSLLSYEERKYVIICRKWFKYFENFYFCKKKIY